MAVGAIETGSVQQREKNQGSGADTEDIQGKKVWRHQAEHVFGCEDEHGNTAGIRYRPLKSVRFHLAVVC
jgi:hypothetical protein